jgi:hypothetical protein
VSRKDLATRIRGTFQSGRGILRLFPNFVPRRFGRPGRRLRLHPDDYFAMGTERGAIKERWFSSVIPAMNGPLAPPDEGMSYVSASDDPEDRFLFREAVDELKADVVGPELQDRYGGWPMYSKFFDYETPLFHHLHLTDDAASKVGRIGKPEAYYFPPELNNYPGQFPVTYFGFAPGVTKEQVRDRLAAYTQEDNRITELSVGYRIQLDTGWYTPPGIVHAPGSYLTYEPQWNSDVNSVQENIAAGEIYPYEFLVENVPDEQKRDLDYVMSLMDWEANTDPEYRRKYFRRPRVVDSGKTRGYAERWIVYGNPYIAGKRLTVPPGATVTVTDQAAHGCIIIQGHGRFGEHEAEAAVMLRFGMPSGDEFFVSENAAREGVRVVNHSRYEPMVVLKHYGPNSGAPAAE